MAELTKQTQNHQKVKDGKIKINPNCHINYTEARYNFTEATLLELETILDVQLTDLDDLVRIKMMMIAFRR